MNFAVDVISYTEVKLSWSLPPAEERNGVIRGFRISYCKKSDCSSPFVIPIQDGNKVTDNIVGLASYTEYDFKILAYTVADGPYTSPVTKRTHEGRTYRETRLIDFVMK